MSQAGAYISSVGPGGPVTTLTGNSGGAVPPTAGNINTVGSGNITVTGNPGTSTLTATLVGTTNHAVQVGNASGSLTSLAVGATGQGLMGNTGADPSWTGSPSFSGTVTAGTGFSATTGNVAVVAGNVTLPNTDASGSIGTIKFGGARWISNNGTGNTFVGGDAGSTGAGAAFNTMLGGLSGNVISGGGNCSVGYLSLSSLNNGSGNNAFGYAALENMLTTGSYNIAIGYQSGISYTTSESSNILLSNSGTIAESNTIRIGTQGAGAGQQNTCFIAGIASVAVSNTNMVTIDTTTGQLGSQAVPSSSITITGDSGGGLTGNSFTFTGGTTGLTFAGAGTTETLGGTLAIANGGTNATSFATTDGTVYYDGTRLVTTATGTSGQVLTSNGAGVAPTYQTFSVLPVAYTNVNTTPYVVLATDYYLSVDCSGGAITVQLPNAPTSDRIFVIKDRTGSAATHNITVTTVGGVVTIDGSTSFVMNTAYESIQLIFNGTSYEVY